MRRSFVYYCFLGEIECLFSLKVVIFIGIFWVWILGFERVIHVLKSAVSQFPCYLGEHVFLFFDFLPRTVNDRDTSSFYFIKGK